MEESKDSREISCIRRIGSDEVIDNFSANDVNDIGGDRSPRRISEQVIQCWKGVGIKVIESPVHLRSGRVFQESHLDVSDVSKRHGHVVKFPEVGKVGIVGA